MIESVRTPEPRVQGQGISPVCDFASRPATKEPGTNCVSTSTGNEPPTRSDELPARSRDSLTSFPHADHQSRQDKRTRGALFTRAPPTQPGQAVQQRSATMFAVYLLCVQARDCSRSNQTMGLCAHMDVTSMM